MADVTIVGQGIFLRGSIRGEGDLEIRGRIEGDVEVSGEVTVADGALVKADISARRIVVRGAVAGNLNGEDGVRLEDGARVVGDLRGATIGIAEGALVRGTVETGQAASDNKARARTATARDAKPAVRPEVRKAPPPPPPPPQVVRGNGAGRRPAPAIEEVEERPGPPPPVVPALKKGARAALRKRSR